MNRNIELKARDADPGRSLHICRSLHADDHGELWQRDTYFVVPSGRLRLREQQPGAACLIQYDRDDRPEERESRYRLATVEDPAAIAAALGAALGVRVIVTKRRRLFVHGAVRIHLDEVEGLGRFIELEAVAPSGSDLSHEQRMVCELRAAFDIGDDRLIATGYADQLEHHPGLINQAAARPEPRRVPPGATIDPTNLAPVTIKGACLDCAGRVLLCRNARQEWELPGGRPEMNESFPACLVREIAEETGLSATSHGLLDAFAYEVLPDHWINVIVYACQIPDHSEPTASPEHDRVAFFDPSILQAQKIANGYRRAIESRLALG